jgi:hypothetical protein
MSMDERLLDVNEHGVLRVPGTMWLALFLLARHWFWVLFILISTSSGGDSFALLNGGVPWIPMVFQLPALLLLLAGARRLPDVGLIPRWLWRRGQMLVLITASLNVSWTVSNLVNSQSWQPRPELVLVCFSILDVVIAWNWWSSSYLRQVMREFPVAASDDS